MAQLPNDIQSHIQRAVQLMNDEAKAIAKGEVNKQSHYANSSSATSELVAAFQSLLNAIDRK